MECDGLKVVHNLMELRLALLLLNNEFSKRPGSSHHLGPYTFYRREENENTKGKFNDPIRWRVLHWTNGMHNVIKLWIFGKKSKG